MRRSSARSYRCLHMSHMGDPAPAIGDNAPTASRELEVRELSLRALANDRVRMALRRVLEIRLRGRADVLAEEAREHVVDVLRRVVAANHELDEIRIRPVLVVEIDRGACELEAVGPPHLVE